MSEHALVEDEASLDPIEQFRRWFDDALHAGLMEPTAMTLATASADGLPSARMVLLKEYDHRGFVLYTNYDSRKGRELAQNPRAALILFWSQFHRQIRIEGMVERVSEEQSDRYFASRARGSQLSAASSEQSSVLSGRRELEERVRALDALYADKPVPRPDDWGGYRVIPRTIEFWQGRPNRLHDRLRYCREGGAWRIERLSP